MSRCAGPARQAQAGPEQQAGQPLASMGAQDLPLPQHLRGPFSSGNSLCTMKETRPGSRPELTHRALREANCVWLSGDSLLVKVGLGPACATRPLITFVHFQVCGGSAIPRGHTPWPNPAPRPALTAFCLNRESLRNAMLSAASRWLISSIFILYFLICSLMSISTHLSTDALGQLMSSGWTEGSMRASRACASTTTLGHPGTPGGSFGFSEPKNPVVTCL